MIATTAGLAGLIGLLVFVSSASAYVYWARGTGEIGRSELNGTSVNNAFITGGSDVQGVAVTATHIYWANRSSGTIGRAAIDGTGVNQSLITGISAPSGIAVDDEHVYWTTASANRIGRARLDGTNVKHNFITLSLAAEGETMTVDGEYLYWADFRGRISRARTDGTDVQQEFIKIPNDDPIGVSVDDGYIYFASFNRNTVGRANLDGSNVDTNFIPSVWRPTGIEVTDDMLFVARVFEDDILRARPDGTGLTTFVPATNAPEDIAVDSKGTVPVSELTPGGHTFAGRPLETGPSAPAELTFRNVGDDVLNVTSIASTNPTEFPVDAANCLGTEPGEHAGTLAPGESCTVLARFDPAVLGQRTATVEVASDGGPAVSNLEGTGLPDPPPECEERTVNVPHEEPTAIPLACTGVIDERTIIEQPVHGSLSAIEDDQVIYTPEPDFAGEDRFIFRATGPGGDPPPTLITLLVASAPSPPPGPPPPPPGPPPAPTPAPTPVPAPQPEPDSERASEPASDGESAGARPGLPAHSGAPGGDGSAAHPGDRATPPRPGHAQMGIAPVDGTTSVRRPGEAAFTEVSRPMVVPVGSIIRAVRGTVAVRYDNGAAADTVARLSGGQFQSRRVSLDHLPSITRDLFSSPAPLRRLLAPVRLAGSLTDAGRRRFFTVVELAGTTAPRPRCRGRRDRARVIAALSGSSDGPLRISGSRSTTVLAGRSAWRVTERCDGTVSAMRRGRGIVNVSATARNVAISAAGGRSAYVARARRRPGSSRAGRIDGACGRRAVGVTVRGVAVDWVDVHVGSMLVERTARRRFTAVTPSLDAGRHHVWAVAHTPAGSVRDDGALRVRCPRVTLTG